MKRSMDVRSVRRHVTTTPRFVICEELVLHDVEDEAMRVKPAVFLICSAIALLSACRDKTLIQPESNTVIVERVSGLSVPQFPAPGVYRLRGVEITGASDSMAFAAKLKIVTDSLARAFEADGLTLTDLWHRGVELCSPPTLSGVIVRFQNPDQRLFVRGLDTSEIWSCAEYWYHARVGQ